MKKLVLILITVSMIGCEASDDEKITPFNQENFYLISEVINYRGELEQKVINIENKIHQIFTHSGWAGGTNNIWDSYEIKYNSQSKIESIYAKEIRTNGEQEDFEELGETIRKPDNLLINFYYNSSNQLNVIENLFDNKERLTFEYDNNKISAILIEEDYGQGFELNRKFYFTYNEGNIIKSKLEYLQFEGETITTYDYDKKLNPFFQYYKNFGLIGYIQAAGVDRFISYLSQNNAIGQVSYYDNVSYQYNEEGYPEVIKYKSDDVPRTNIIQYLQ